MLSTIFVIAEFLDFFFPQHLLLLGDLLPLEPKPAENLSEIPTGKAVESCRSEHGGSEGVWGWNMILPVACKYSSQRCL